MDYRYCRRCWPAAHRCALKAQRAAVLAWFAASHRAAQDYMAGRRETPEAPTPDAFSTAWHWSLIPGTWWREYRYRLRRSDVAAV
jgi:hypothetical protein